MNAPKSTTAKASTAASTREPDADPLHRELETQRVRQHIAQCLDWPKQAVERALAQEDYLALLQRMVAKRRANPAVEALREPLEGLLEAKVKRHPAQGRSVQGRPTQGRSAQGRPTQGRLAPHPRGTTPGSAASTRTHHAAALTIPAVVFGTGGHRGRLGEGMTWLHVHAIVTALLETVTALSPEERQRFFGRPTEAEVRQAGWGIGHDNRLFNTDFAAYAGYLLQQAGHRVCYVARAATPEFSLVTPLEGWAGSINLTPSHNPFQDGGIKLGLHDGALAGSELTDPLAARANAILNTLDPTAWPSESALSAAAEAGRARWPRFDIHQPYLDALESQPLLQLRALRADLRELPPEKRPRLYVDAVWGGTVPLYQRLQTYLGSDVVTLLHTEDDPYFGGEQVEPNEAALTAARRLAADEGRALHVCLRNDPDGDRGLVGDAQGAIKMNRFAALVTRFLAEQSPKITSALGDRPPPDTLLTTYATSHLGPDHARRLGLKVVRTPVGFKHFRPWLSSGKALLAYEESDGLTIFNHTLDKDGILVGLLALRMVLHYQKPLHTLLAELTAAMGPYHWQVRSVSVDAPAASVRVRLKEILSAKRPGESLFDDFDDDLAAAAPARIGQIESEDGFKFHLEDGSWVMVRPSGTEPKLRIYAETRRSAEATEALITRSSAHFQALLSR